MKMFLPWLLVTVASLLFLIYKFAVGRKGEKSKKKGESDNFWLIAKNVYKFCFVVKSEDRLNAFKTIHKFLPRYCRFRIFSYDNIVIYDPELCRKVFNAQSACQRPFRNCIQLECGLLSSECEFSTPQITELLL